MRAHLAWAVGPLRSTEALHDRKVASHFTDEYLATVPADMITHLLNSFREETGSIAVRELVHHSPTRASWFVVGEQGGQWGVNCSIEAAPPGRLDFLFAKDNGPSVYGVSVRDATPDDAEALAELERAARWELGDVALVTDRGTDYFVQARLLDDPTVVGAERDGQLVGTLSTTSHPALVDGTSYEALCVEHARVHPDHQGLGIFKQLTTRMLDIFWELDTRLAYSFVHPDNATLQAVAARSFTTKWRARPCVLTIERDHAARPEGARPAAPEDLDWVADTLNAHHAGEALWSPCTAESLQRRLARAPDAYSFADLWICGGAVLGTWAAHGHTTVTRIAPDATTVRRDAVVLDFGFEAGAEDDFGRLLDWQASARREQGATGLLLVVSPGSSAHSVASTRAASTHPMEMYCQPITDIPWKFEAGTPPIAEVVGLGAAIDYRNGIGFDAVRRHEKALTTFALDTLRTRFGDRITIQGPEDIEQRGGVISFALEGLHPHDIAQVLDQHGVCVRASHHCAKPLMRRLGFGATVRASLYIYNDEQDVHALADALDESIKLFLL